MATASRATVNWVMVIYFCSGACSLIDEVVWLRLLKLSLGNTVYASSIVVSVFMGGLALGALIMSRFADRVKKHLKLYALLELLITVSALSMPWALRLADKGYVLFYRRFQPGPASLLAVQIIFSAMLLLIPTMLMGSTLPLLGRFITNLESKVGQLVGRLYALNMLGAALGCFLAGFVFLRSFGVMGTLYIAAGLNLLVSFGGWFLSFFSKISIPPQDKKAKSELFINAVRKVDARFYLLVTAFFMSGLICIAYEIIWMRSVIHLIGGTTYVFSAVLTIYLLGNVIGVGIGSRLSRLMKAPVLGFALTISLLGACGLFYLPFLRWVSEAIPNFKPLFKIGYSEVLVSGFYFFRPLFQSAVLFLIPSVIMGIGFPLALQGWAYHMHKVARTTGTAYTANTIGAVAGGIVAGFIVIPLMGVHSSMLLFSLSALTIGTVLFILFHPGPGIYSRVIFSCLAVFLALLGLGVPGDSFHKIVSKIDLPTSPLLLAVREGINTTVSVHQDGNGRYLYASGQSLAGDNQVSRTDQKLLGHFGLMLHPDAKKVLSVGFGSGETTACLWRHGLEKIDCVEIAPEVVETSLEYFDHINLGKSLNEKINMIYMDAKNYINLTEQKYDLIINDSMHPKTFAENASLYTKEYFQSAKAHLNDKGMFVSWVPTYEMNFLVMDSIIGTLMEVFPYVTLWYPSSSPAPLVILVASEHPQLYSLSFIEDKLALPDLSEDMKSINIYNAMDFLSCYICDERSLQKLISDYSVNSDFRAFVEFDIASSVLRSSLFDRYIWNVRSDSVSDHIIWAGSTEHRDKWIREFQDVYQASTYLLKSHQAGIRGDYLAMLKHVTEGLTIAPGYPALIMARSNCEKLLRSHAISLLRSGQINKPAEIAGKMLDIYPGSSSAWFIRSGIAQHEGNMQKALSAANKAVDFAQNNAETHKRLGDVFLITKQISKAVVEYKKAMNLEPDNLNILKALIPHLVIEKGAEFYDPAHACELAERACEMTYFKDAEFVHFLAMAYAAKGSFSDAVVTAQRAIELLRSSGEDEIADEISQGIELYKTRQNKR